ncbi:MAG: M50 family metallopeptidase [Myxococcota bacterium]
MSVLIILHELGHYWAARAFDIRVLRFSIGFGPTLLSHTRGETQWQIALLPFGGFVQVDGLGLREDDVVNDERNYRNKAAWQRAIFVFAGPLVNWLLAAAFIAGLGMTAGIMQPLSSATIGVVGDDTPAARAGLLIGDEIVRVDGELIAGWEGLVSAIGEHRDRDMTLTVKRGPETLEIVARPQDGRLGVGVAQRRVRYGVGESIGAGIGYAWNGSGQLVQLLWGMLSGTRSGEFSGVPRIVQVLSSQAQEGVDRLIQTLAWLSVTLCVLNLTPIPAVDGGRLLFIALEVARGRPTPEHIEATIHGVGMMILLGFALFLAIRDVI